MKGIFIPEITVEMFRDACLESIEALMAEGEVYDIEYDPKSEEQDVPDISVGKWVSCGERLPETNETVLVTCRTKKGANNVNRAYCDKEGFWHGSGSMSNVVAWMPLPKPYREDEEIR